MIWIQHNAGEGAPIFDVKGQSGAFMPEVQPEKDEKIIVKGAPSRCVETATSALDASRVERACISCFGKPSC